MGTPLSTAPGGEGRLLSALLADPQALSA